MAAAFLQGDSGLLGWAAQLLMGSSLRCDAAALSLPQLPGIEVVSLAAEEQRNFTYTPSNFSGLSEVDPISGLDFCNVTVAYTHPGWNDVVHVNSLLPLDNWNGRFVGVGGGGYVTGGGIFSDFTTFPFMAEGYAVATTDGGHSSEPDQITSFNTSWVLNSPGVINWPGIVNFASVALHDAATIGKAVAQTLYGKAPEYSYFYGGSTGGRQGHMLAQRYPDDFNGIMSAYPAINWAKFLFVGIWPKFVMDQMKTYPRQCEVDAITNAAIAACDGLDGVEDGIISRPDLCDFEARSAVGNVADCDNGKTVAITTAAADVVDAAWAGPRSSTGEFQWYGFPKGTNLTKPVVGPILTQCDWKGSCKGSSFSISNVWARYWVAKNPDLDLATITHQQWDELVHASVQEYESIIDTADPDLSAFKSRGGKMISWHGTIDSSIPVNGSVDYYERVLKGDSQATDCYRFFLAPGARHCYGCGPTPPMNMDMMVDWVEKGIAPDTMAVSGRDGHGAQTERDLCLYPQVQHYIGGDPAVRSSFTCV